MAVSPLGTRVWRPTIGRVSDITDDRMRMIVYRLLCLFWFTMPGEGIIRIGGEATISKGAGAVVFLAALVSVFKTGRRSRANDYIILLFAFASWVALSSYWSITPQQSEQRIITMFQLVIMVLISWEFAHNDRCIRGLMAAWTAGCIVITVIIVIAFALGDSQKRYTAPGTHPGDQAYSLLLAIPMAWYLSIRTARRALALAYRLFVPFATLGVILTASRAALLSAVLALLIIPLTLSWTSVRTRLALSFGVVLAAFATVVLIADASGPIQRLSTTSSEISSGTLDNRTTLWSIALRLIAKHPILGLGTGGSKVAVGAQFTEDRGLHDTFLSVGVELGLVGIALFLLLLLAAMYRALTRLTRLEARLAWVLAAEYIISLVPRQDDYVKSTYAIMTLLALMGSVYATRSRRADYEPPAVPELIDRVPPDPAPVAQEPPSGRHALV